MIQRIQTVYLLVSTILLGIIFWLPLAVINAAGEPYLFDIKGVHKAAEVVISGLPLIVLLALIVVLQLVAIFSYKKRIRQIKILIFSMILLIGILALFFWFAYWGFKGAVVSFKIACIFPFVAIVLDYLAIRAIGKDETLIRSLNRIR